MYGWIYSLGIGFLVGVTASELRNRLSQVGSCAYSWTDKLKPERTASSAILFYVLFVLDGILFILMQLPLIALMFVSSHAVAGVDLRVLVKNPALWDGQAITNGLVWLGGMIAGIQLDRWWITLREERKIARGTRESIRDLILQPLPCTIGVWTRDKG